MHLDGGNDYLLAGSLVSLKHHSVSREECYFALRFVKFLAPALANKGLMNHT